MKRPVVRILDMVLEQGRRGVTSAERKRSKCWCLTFKKGRISFYWFSTQLSLQRALENTYVCVPETFWLRTSGRDLVDCRMGASWGPCVQMEVHSGTRFFFFSPKGHSAAHGSSQASGWIRAAVLAYATATATWDLSRICDRHHSSPQHQILNPARPGMEPTSSWKLIGFVTHWATAGTPETGSSSV